MGDENQLDMDKSSKLIEGKKWYRKVPHRYVFNLQLN